MSKNKMSKDKKEKEKEKPDLGGVLNVLDDSRKYDDSVSVSLVKNQIRSERGTDPLPYTFIAHFEGFSQSEALELAARTLMIRHATKVRENWSAMKPVNGIIEVSKKDFDAIARQKKESWQELVDRLGTEEAVKVLMAYEVEKKERDEAKLAEQGGRHLSPEEIAKDYG